MREIKTFEIYLIITSLFLCIWIYAILVYLFVELRDQNYYSFVDLCIIGLNNFFTMIYI